MPKTYQERLQEWVGRDPSVDNGPDQGFEGPVIEVGRENGRLYVDVDWGYRFYIDEEQPLTIVEASNPKPIGEWCRDTHPHLFK